MLQDDARDARGAVKASYRGFKRQPLSKIQKSRKLGARGHGEELVGHRGEKMIDHIEARDGDGAKVNDN